MVTENGSPSFLKRSPSFLKTFHLEWEFMTFLKKGVALLENHKNSSQNKGNLRLFEIADLKFDSEFDYAQDSCTVQKDCTTWFRDSRRLLSDNFLDHCLDHFWDLTP